MLQGGAAEQPAAEGYRFGAKKGRLHLVRCVAKMHFCTHFVEQNVEQSKGTRMVRMNSPWSDGSLAKTCFATSTPSADQTPRAINAYLSESLCSCCALGNLVEVPGGRKGEVDMDMCCCCSRL